MMENYYAIDDSGDIQDIWDNDFGVVSLLLLSFAV